MTGGAGTGKTTVLQIILSCLTQLGENADDVVLTAPTGKAAVRMTETTGYPASTLHKVLGLTKASKNRMIDEAAPKTQASFIVSDEFSMVDNYLAYCLFAFLSNNTRVLLLGDTGQLQSVGAGCVLHDMLESKLIPVTMLKVIFRQSDTSNIVYNSNNIYQGKKQLKFENDCKFTNINEPEQIAEQVINLFKERCDIYGIEETVILTPVKKNVLGTYALNERIQDIINPLKSGIIEKKYHSMRFRTNDRVIQLQNREVQNIDGDTVDICNGDTGFIKDISNTGDVTIVFSGDRTVIFDKDDMQEVTLAYAMTIHKSQGSEFKSVIMPISFIFPSSMMIRNLLYTGVTRAKKEIHIVGDKAMIYRCIDNNVGTNRNTALTDKIKYYYDSENQ